ncbi:MAG: TonB-dependent receptor [Pseudomonadota bacterium]
MRAVFCAIFAGILTVPAVAQDLSGQEIIVTASRVDQDDYSDFQPAIGLKRKADFLVQQVVIRGDTRDAEQRAEEILQMLRAAIQIADKGSIELATGDYTLTKLTLNNADEVTLQRDRRPDSQRLNFLVKAPLASQSLEKAQAEIRSFIEDVPEVGRAQMDEYDDATLSVVGPDQYRDAIIAQINADARKQAAGLGDDYAAELTGLNMPVQWTRAGPSEVLLFIPYQLKVRPR